MAVILLYIYCQKYFALYNEKYIFLDLVFLFMTTIGRMMSGYDLLILFIYRWMTTLGRMMSGSGSTSATRRWSQKIYL